MAQHTRRMLKSKIHRATVTDSDLRYEGSISLDPALMTRADIREFEEVTVLNVNTGARFTTYAITGGPGEVCLNGAAARLVQRGDVVILLSYVETADEDLDGHRPTLVFVDEHNRIAAH